MIEETVRLAGALGAEKVCVMSGLPGGCDTDRVLNWIVSSGRIRVVGEIARFTADNVSTVSGQSIAPDIVIAATGYTSRLADLLDGVDIQIKPPTMASETPGIWLIGMKPGLVSYFRNAFKEATAMSKRMAVE